MKIVQTSLRLLSMMAVTVIIDMTMAFSSPSSVATTNQCSRQLLTTMKTTSSLSATSAAAAAAQDNGTFYRAVELASSGQNHKMDLEELDRLATELEEVQGCNFEKDGGEQLCDKEIQDRLDVAEILRLQIELQLRMDYLENANLFADDVKRQHNTQERQKFKDALLENREKSPPGSDLGLW